MYICIVCKIVEDILLNSVMLCYVSGMLTFGTPCTNTPKIWLNCLEHANGFF